MSEQPQWKWSREKRQDTIRALSQVLESLGVPTMTVAPIRKFADSLSLEEEVDANE